MRRIWYGLTIHRIKEVNEPEVLLWHHKVDRHKVQKAKDNIGGVFHLPKMYAGQHFAIHPEWPIA